MGKRGESLGSYSDSVKALVVSFACMNTSQFITEKNTDVSQNFCDRGKGCVVHCSVEAEVN